MTKLYEASNHILIHAGYTNPAKHSHMAAHIIISLGEKMHIKSDGIDFKCYGVMVPSGVSHMIDTFGKDALVFLYDCTTDIASQIHSIRPISKEYCKKIISDYSNFEKDCAPANYRRFEKSVLTRLGFIRTKHRANDERIISAMKYIRSMSSENLSCKEVADAVNLSQSRFSHLFKNQVGMTFAAYLIYQRIMNVYTQTLQGKAITEAALEAGFSSSAHFADVNRRVFGLSARTITHDLMFIKI